MLPEIKDEFRLSVTQVSWVSTVYMLIYAIGSVIYGKLADVFKLKNLLTFGLILFCLGSLAGLAAQAFWTVLLARILQSAGAAVVPAAAGWIAAVLIFSNVGQMFMQLALSNTISRTLPKEQIGVGMGLLSLLSFLSGAVSTSIYSKAVDHGSAWHWNPFNPFAGSAVYGNVYLVLALLHLGILLFYYFFFRRIEPSSGKKSSTA